MKEPLKLTYHDDKKGKWQSHEIDSPYLEDIKFDLYVACEASKEEAYEAYIEKLDNYMAKLQEYRANISLEQAVTVDGSGNPKEDK